MFLFKKYFYIILILLIIPLLGLAASINNKYTFEILDPSIDTTFIIGDPLLISWQIKGSSATLETLVNQNRIARIYLKQKSGKIDRVLKTVGAVTLLDEMIECSDEQEMNCTLTQEYEWSKIPTLSSKSNYYIRITLRSKQNLGAFIKAFFLWSKYPFADSAIFNINSLAGTQLLNSSSTGTSINNITTTTTKTVTDSIENLNPKSEVLPITPPKIEAPRNIIFANIDIPLEAKNYVKANEDLYPPIYLTPEYYVDKTSTYNNAASRNQAIELVAQKGPYLATLYKILAGENIQQYRQIKFYPNGKYEEIPTQWSVIDSKLVKYYSFLPINPNGLSNKDALTYRFSLYNTMVNVLNVISSGNMGNYGEDRERLKISYSLRHEILTLMANEKGMDNFSCDINSVNNTIQKLEEARKRMSINCPDKEQCNQSPSCLYECKAFNNARNLLSEYKGLCTLMTSNNAYAELIKTVEDRAINSGYEKVTLLKRGDYNELLNSYITNDINILGKSITRCATDTNNKCWSSYNVWPSNFTIYPDNISGGTIPRPYLLVPTEYQFGDGELSENIFPTGTEYLVNGESVTDRITQLSEKYGNLAEAIVYKNGWGFSPLPAPKGTIDSNGNYKAPTAVGDGIIINTILAHSSEGDRHFNVYILPKDKLASDLLAPIFNKSFESGNPKYVMGNALHYCDLNLSEYIGNTFGVEQASDYVLYIKNKSENITPTIVNYNDYSMGGTSRLVLKWPINQIGNLTIGSFSISNNLKTKTLEMFLDHCQKSGACPYGSN